MVLHIFFNMYKLQHEEFFKFRGFRAMEVVLH